MVCSDFVIPAADFDPDFVKQFSPLVRKGRRKHDQREVKYLPLICAFDIETTTLQDIKQAFMYHWQFQFDRYCTITGRTWAEFTDFIAGLIGALEDRTLVVYVHNLSYEWQFISDPEIYDFIDEEIFAMDTRSILKAKMGRALEFRCSFRLFNMGLGPVTKNFRVKHQKLDGDDYDYNKIRYPWTPLSPMELQYCYNDVRGLVESIYAIMDAYGDTLLTIPLTSTGYPRRDCKKVLYSIHGAIKQLIPPFEVYQLLRKAFRGGDTHASRHWAGAILEDIYSDDRSSSYPDVNANCRYPMSSWHEVSPGNLNEDYIIDLIIRRQKACIMEVEIDDLDLRDPDWPDPYLTYDKCEEIEWHTYDENPAPAKDNGRIIHAKHLKTYLTDLDLKIVLQVYNGHLTFKRCYYAAYGNLPRRFIAVINGYYKAKTSLKREEWSDEDIQDKINYDESKKKANGIYGMEATDPIKVKINYDGVKLDFDKDPDIGALYEEYKKKAWIPYSWGVWTTSLSRMELFRGMTAIAEDPEGGGCRDLVYWDTDSLKHFREHRAAMEKLNRGYRKNSKSNDAMGIDSEGKTHYMGVFEYECKYKTFLTWGAKKYAYTFEGEGTECHVTIAGVNKKEGGKELEEKGGLPALKEGFVFEKAGGTESRYNDVVPPEYQNLIIEGHKLHITKNIALSPSTYELLSDPGDYLQILDDADVWRKILDDEQIYHYNTVHTVKS